MSSKPTKNMSTHAEQAQTFLLPNNATVLTSTEAAKSKTYLFLNELTNGVTGTIILMGNKDEYQIFKDHDFILEFDGATSVRKASGKDGGFVRYPFQLQEKPDNLGDVVGRPRRCVDQKENEQYKLYQFSSSSTQILDDPQLHVLNALKVENIEGEGSLNQVVTDVDYSQPKDGTLEYLLIWARNQKNDSSTFNCKVRIDNIRTRNGWNFPSCGGDKCTKGIARKEGSFWCEACNKNVEYPVLRFRLELDVSNKSASTVVVMFDGPAIELLKCSAYLIMEADDEKLATSKVVEESVCSSNANALADVKTKKLKRLATYPAVATASKPTEDKKKKRVELEYLDDEVTCASRDGPDDANESSPLDKRKKERYIVDDCNTPNQRNQMLHKRYVNRAKV
nr:hypothetical protein [Tanacetum cinerariifolium]